MSSVQSDGGRPPRAVAGAIERIMVEAGEAGLRVDELLARRLGIGRRAAVRLAAECARNGRRVRKGTRVDAGDEITAPAAAWPGAPPPAGEPGGPTPRIARLTPEVAVVMKPAGLATVSLAGRPGASLAAWLAARLPECAPLGGAGEGGLAHRLDTGTSGLLLAARTEHAYRHLRSQFDRHAIEKSYLAIVAGTPPPSLRIEADVGQHHRSRRRMRALPASGRARSRYSIQEATTAVEVVERLGRASLVRATTRTGVRHQIRVHLAHAGYPLLGDRLYGGGIAPGGDGYLLHAERIRWIDPTSGATEDDAEPAPEEWSEVRRRLGEAGESEA